MVSSNVDLEYHEIVFLSSFEFQGQFHYVGVTSNFDRKLILPKIPYIFQVVSIKPPFVKSSASRLLYGILFPIWVVEDCILRSISQ